MSDFNRKTSFPRPKHCVRFREQKQYKLKCKQMTRGSAHHRYPLLLCCVRTERYRAMMHWDTGLWLLDADLPTPLFPATPPLFPAPPPSMQHPGCGGGELVIWQQRHKSKTSSKLFWFVENKGLIPPSLPLQLKRLWTEGIELPLSGLLVTHCSSTTTSALNQNWKSNSTFFL